LHHRRPLGSQGHPLDDVGLLEEDWVQQQIASDGDRNFHGDAGGRLQNHLRRHRHDRTIDAERLQELSTNGFTLGSCGSRNHGISSSLEGSVLGRMTQKVDSCKLAGRKKHHEDQWCHKR
jgi:hypothetical protein